MAIPHPGTPKSTLLAHRQLDQLMASVDAEPHPDREKRSNFVSNVQLQLRGIETRTEDLSVRTRVKVVRDRLLTRHMGMGQPGGPIAYRRYTIVLDRLPWEDSADGEIDVTDPDEGRRQVAAELREAVIEYGLPVGYFNVVAVEEREDHEYGPNFGAV